MLRGTGQIADEESLTFCGFQQLLAECHKFCPGKKVVTGTGTQLTLLLIIVITTSIMLYERSGSSSIGDKNAREKTCVAILALHDFKHLTERLLDSKIAGADNGDLDAINSRRVDAQKLLYFVNEQGREL